MSYLVPREIPPDCTKCRWAMCNYPTVYCRLMHKGSDMLMAIKSRPDWCPLVEIKIPHGRLGDLDALWDKMSNYSDNEGAKMPFGDDDTTIHRDSACFIIEQAPTIIEAEGE